jgi:hypothetical protein
MPNHTSLEQKGDVAMLLPTTKCVVTSQKTINKDMAKEVMQSSSKLDVVEGMW